MLVSLGTDWTPSGSRTLLHELKVADDALRDPRLLGGSRDEVPAFALAAKSPAQRLLVETALDRALVDMVTRTRRSRCAGTTRPVRSRQARSPTCC